MFAILALGFVSAALAPTLAPRLGRRAGPVFALVPAAILVWLGFQASTVLGGGAVVAQLAWVPELGVSLDLRLDGLSFVFATLVSAVGLLVTVYAQGYLGQHPELGRFFLYLHAFMGAMLGLVLADDLVALFVFWELTSVTSYLLVGFQAKSEAARRAALKALLITGGGGLALLAGLLIVSQIAGDRSLSAILAATDLDAHALYPAAVLLIAAGAFTKSAQVPFHIWLPGAMAAPAPVSAYLHSATMVKAGVYLLARLNPALGGTPLWSNLLVVVGGATLLTAGVLAIGQRDLKRLLAYSTVSALGTMVLLIGVGTPVAIRAMVVVLLSHALYKGALFMLAGVVDKQTGTRDVTRLAGLRHSMPKTAAAAFLAALSMAGLPPLLGFVGKELFYEATLYGGTAALTLTLVAVLGNSLTVAVAGIVGVRPFLGPRAAATEGGTAAATDPKASLWVPPLILAVLGLLAEVIPGFGSGVLVRPASTAILGVPDTANIYLWHGFTPMLALSVITVALGVAVAWRAPRWRSASDKLGAVAALGPDRVYERGLRGLVRLALRKTRAMQTGYLRHYVTWIVVTLLALVAWAWLVHWRPTLTLGPIRVDPFEIVLLLLVLASAGLVLRTRSRLTAVAALGGVGVGVSLLFLLYSAPDVAATQFAVETLAVLLFVFVIYKLPRFSSLSSAAQRRRDAALALAAGVMVSALVLAVSAREHVSRIAPWMAEESVPSGMGRNVVNVILVDFRALDTLGEVIVLTIAAIGVLALLAARKRAGGEAS